MPSECALSLENLPSVPQELFRDRITRLSVGRMTGGLSRARARDGLRLTA